ncbi:hypothetical protein X560_1681 [Listeria fleischmannii 1991]|uniref:Uncharacterized protein n=2 Tax=Listeria fleischmannii TaxID=1069827 RepID=A0A2X3HJ08_9LIST|nr:hypothetical protein [Listeria fleischmannii]EMG29325.1 hypothetical protein LFLEISCH_00125 [Listeria fleischmannii subsp. fleischmannii LU2006-1]KMT59140.1 hypothetical protein X560_1681 [Listeria fleischmannii 1991]SQC72221.1 Uncharacterised protein [Listeria fleischmannii subsp. fleischmannii]
MIFEWLIDFLVWLFWDIIREAITEFFYWLFDKITFGKRGRKIKPRKIKPAKSKYGRIKRGKYSRY